MNTALLNTKEKIVELSRNSIQQIGYHSFNYKQIAEALNIRNAAIHHYYPSKEDLGVAVLEKDRQNFLSMVQKSSKSTATKKLELWLKFYTDLYENGHRLCLIGTFCSSYQSIPPKVGVAAKQYFELIVTWFTETFSQGLQAGEFTFETPVNEMVNTWITVLPGSLQIGRIRGDDYFYSVIKSLRKSLRKK